VGGPISQAVVDSFEELISRIKAAVAELDK